MTKEIKFADQNTGLPLTLDEYFSAMDKKKPLKMNYPWQKLQCIREPGHFKITFKGSERHIRWN